MNGSYIKHFKFVFKTFWTSKEIRGREKYIFVSFFGNNEVIVVYMYVYTFGLTSHQLPQISREKEMRSGEPWIVSTHE